LEEQLVGCVDAVLERACSERVERAFHGVEDRDRANTGAALWSLEPVARIGTFNMEQSLFTVDV
jgi:hypothetical protein